MEGSGFGLGDFADLAVKFAGGSLVKADLAGETGFFDCVEETEGANGIDFGGVFGDLEGDFDVALGSEVVNFVRRDALKDAV